jgi:hypothetical protein
MRLCANGEACVAFAQLGQAARLSRYSDRDVCEACHQLALDEVSPAVPSEPARTPRPRRTANGTGAKPYLRPDGRWQARYFDKDGKRRAVYARSEEMAQVKLIAALAERDGRDARGRRAALNFNPEDLVALADALSAAEKRLRHVAWLLTGAGDN